jgi:hypothetical protein
MPYFHHTICISPQNTFPDKKNIRFLELKENLLKVIEPDYPGIPAGIKRRMSKSVRMAVGSALPLLENYSVKPDGIIMGTSNGGLEDCFRFLIQILEYNEGLLTPGSFVQSTSNASAAQIALITKNHGYNITHVHRGLAFENALLDTMMLLKENPRSTFLLGAVDEISEFNYNIDRLAGCFRDYPVSNFHLFDNPEKGTIAGEGSFMTVIDNKKENALAEMIAVKTIHSTEPEDIHAYLLNFMEENSNSQKTPDLLITGENGDLRLNHYYEKIESCFPRSLPVARFKHLCGEYSTATSFACWLASEIFVNHEIPSVVMKRGEGIGDCRRILIYNNFRGLQHSFILMKSVS